MDIQERSAGLFGNFPALRMPEKTLSFEEYNNQAVQIANLLYQKGLRSGDIIAVPLVVGLGGSLATLTAGLA